MLEPPELERAARLLEVGLTVSARRARQMLGLPSHHARDPAAAAFGEADPRLALPMASPCHGAEEG